jgi:hypothetical protein
LYEIHGQRIGLRSTSVRFSEWLDGALARYAVGSETASSHHYSIVVGEPVEGPMTRPRGRKLHILYRGTAAIVRTTDIHTLCRALFCELGASALAERDDAIYLAAGALVGRDGAALVPGYFVSRLARLRRRAELSGLLLPGSTAVALDLDGRHVLPLPELEVHPDALPQLAATGLSSQRDERGFIDRPIELGAMLSLGPSEVPGLQPAAAALSLYRWSAKVINLATLGGRAVETLGRVMGEVPSLQVGWQDPATWLGALGDSLASTSGGSSRVDGTYAARGSGNTRGGR